MQIQGSYVLLLAQVNRKYKGHTDDHANYRGSDMSSLLYATNHSGTTLLGALLEAIKGGAQGFVQRGEDLTFFNLHD
jgi:hypothetical protein